MDQSSLPASIPEIRYVISGEGRDEFTRIDLRNRIREGTLTPATEIARAGTETWIPASKVPELARYFSLAGKSMTADPSLMVGSRPVNQGAPAVESVASRLIPGLAYPLTAVGISLMVVLAIAQQIPIVKILAGLLGPLYSLIIIRASARGEKTFPGLNQVGNPGQLLLLLAKLIVVTLVSAWPVILAVLFVFVLPMMVRPIIFIALIVTIFYYPACIATLAVWNSIKFALTPSQIFSFIRILGIDHVLAVMAWFASFALAMAVTLGGVFAEIPPRPLAVLSAVILVWGGFYSSHILGWAVARHRDELE